MVRFRGLVIYLCASIMLAGCHPGNNATSVADGSSSSDSSYADAWGKREVPAPSATVGRTVEQVFGEESDEYPPEGVVLGQGWNRGFGVRTLNQCVEGTTSTQQGGTVTLAFHYIFDSEQLQSMLSISAHGKYGAGGFGVDASSTYTELSSRDRTQTHILGMAQSDKGASFLTDGPTPLKLTKTAQAILNSGTDGPKRFLQACGDGFVSSIRIGGQLSYLFDQDTLKTADQKTFILSVSASGWGASGGVDVTTQDIKNTYNENKNVHVFQSGGKLTTPTDMKDAIAHIESYGDYESSLAVPYRIVITPYSVVAPTAALIDTHAADIRSLAVAIDRTKELENIYNNALADPNQFYLPYTPVNELADDYGVLATVRRCLEQILLQCRATGDCDFRSLTINTVPLRCPAADLTNQPSLITYTPAQLARIIVMLPGDKQDKASTLVTLLQDPKAHLHVAGTQATKGEGDKSNNASSPATQAPWQALAVPDLAKAIQGPWSRLNDQPTPPTNLPESLGKAKTQVEHAMSPDGYALTYFDYLARAPLKKNQQNLLLDEVQMAIALCATRAAVQGDPQPNCGETKSFAVVAPAPDDPHLKTIKTWVIYGRVYPAAMGACDANENGVLCADIRWINAYVLANLPQPLITADQNFQPPPQKPPPPPPQPPPYHHEPCMGHAAHSNCT